MTFCLNLSSCQASYWIQHSRREAESGEMTFSFLQFLLTELFEKSATLEIFCELKVKCRCLRIR